MSRQPKDIEDVYYKLEYIAELLEKIIPEEVSPGGKEEIKLSPAYVVFDRFFGQCKPSDKFQIVSMRFLCDGGAMVQFAENPVVQLKFDKNGISYARVDNEFVPIAHLEN